MTNGRYLWQIQWPSRISRIANHLQDIQKEVLLVRNMPTAADFGILQQNECEPLASDGSSWTDARQSDTLNPSRILQSRDQD